MKREELKQAGIFKVYNRGNNRKKIFYAEEDFNRFSKTAVLFQFSQSFPNLHRLLAKPDLKLPNEPKSVELIDQELEAHQFTLILNQNDSEKISKNMQRLMTSYTKYFNEKYSHEGALFHGSYKLEPWSAHSSISELGV